METLPGVRAHAWRPLPASSRQDRCERCGILRHRYSGRLSSIFAEIPALLDEVRLRWPSVDPAGSNVRGLVAYATDDGAWSLQRPDCVPTPVPSEAA